MVYISIDSETTGVDLYHGARPYLVSVCDEEWNNTYFEWDVDPLTREVMIPAKDRADIWEMINEAEMIVGQNIKFDATALAHVLPKDFKWPWHKTHDTLIAGHLLGSNHQKDLTSMAVEYLAVNIQPFEDEMEGVIQHCRNLVRAKNSPIGDWVIAKEGLPGMPSAKAKVWKFDGWLPRAIAKRKLCDWEPSWLYVSRDYCNADTSTTLALFIQQRKLLEKRGLWLLYEERMRQIPVIHRIERQGVSLNYSRLHELKSKYRTVSRNHEQKCENIAKSLGTTVELPKSGKNKSLTTFMFETLKLPPIRNNPKAKTSDPCLNKDALIEYCDTLDPKSQGHAFVRSLQERQAVNTSLGFLDAYRRFSIPELDASGKWDHQWLRLHPNINMTGTDTLRTSSNNPNSQNVSKREGYNLRYCFGPREGREWWSIDYENLELRIPAYECGEPAMLELFEHPERAPYFGSYHLLIFSILHPDKYDHNDPEGLLKAKDKYKSTWYGWTKNGNFAEMYGAVSSSGTADRAFHVPGAQDIVAARLSEKTKLAQHYIDFANRHGYVETIPDKSIDPRRGYPLLCTRSMHGRVLPTVPFNYHVQGTACQTMRRATVLIEQHLNELSEKTGFDGAMVMDIHDEIVLDFPYQPNKGNLPIVRDIQSIMNKHGDDIGIKLTTNAEYHPKNWAEKE